MAAASALGAAALPPPASPADAGPPQQGEISTTIRIDGGGAPPRLAVPDFIALSSDAETAAIAKTIAQVLYDDLAFEREFALIPRDTYASIPAAKSFTDVPFDRWRELNADGLVIGTVQKTDTGVRVQVRLFRVSTRESAFGKEYGGSANARLYAHTIADEVHQQQRGLRGVARTRLAFDSDRDGERIGGTIEQRSVKEIYYADYDGENQKRFTVNRSLNITPAWSPDSASLAYVSFRGGHGGNIFISNLRQGTQQDLTKGSARTGCPPGRPTARASRSRRRATATPKSTSRTATART